MKTSTSFWFVALVLSVLSFAGFAQAGLVVFGTGFSLPESISLVPTGFGTYGGDYFIPDPGINALGLGNVDYLPPTGGTASVFVTIPGQTPCDRWADYFCQAVSALTVDSTWR